MVFLPGWNEISELKTLLEHDPVFGNPSKALIHTLHSGIPLSWVRIRSAPFTSELTICPFALTTQLHDSTTSRKTSFFW